MTTIEYREAPPAVNFGSLTTATGTAPPVAQKPSRASSGRSG